MDYCNGGSLSSILDEYKLRFGKPFSQEIIQHFMIQIVDGLKYIHSKNIIHRDIKLDNILLNFDNIEDKNNLNLLSANIKIIDFGLATKLSKNGMAKTYLGTPLNMDPNILKKYDKAGGYFILQGYNQKADIWSLGTICFEMLTGEVLFKGENIKDLVEQEDQGDYSIPINFEISKEIISFLKSMLQYNGENRLSAEELSKHDFLVKDVKNFAKINFQLMYNKIENGMLNFNIKHNSTLIQYIKNDEKCLPKIGN
jgi:serine/threonine protein kinase